MTIAEYSDFWNNLEKNRCDQYTLVCALIEKLIAIEQKEKKQISKGLRWQFIFAQMMNTLYFVHLFYLSKTQTGVPAHEKKRIANESKKLVKSLKDWDEHLMKIEKKKRKKYDSTDSKKSIMTSISRKRSKELDFYNARLPLRHIQHVSRPVYDVYSKSMSETAGEVCAHSSSVTSMLIDIIQSDSTAAVEMRKQLSHVTVTNNAYFSDAHDPILAAGARGCPYTYVWLLRALETSDQATDHVIRGWRLLYTLIRELGVLIKHVPTQLPYASQASTLQIANLAFVFQVLIARYPPLEIPLMMKAISAIIHSGIEYWPFPICTIIDSLKSTLNKEFSIPGSAYHKLLRKEIPLIKKAQELAKTIAGNDADASTNTNDVTKEQVQESIVEEWEASCKIGLESIHACVHLFASKFEDMTTKTETLAKCFAADSNRDLQHIIDESMDYMQKEIVNSFKISLITIGGSLDIAEWPNHTELLAMLSSHYSNADRKLLGLSYISFCCILDINGEEDRSHTMKNWHGLKNRTMKYLRSSLGCGKVEAGKRVYHSFNIVHFILSDIPALVQYIDPLFDIFTKHYDDSSTVPKGEKSRLPFLPNTQKLMKTNGNVPQLNFLRPVFLTTTDVEEDSERERLTSSNSSHRRRVSSSIMGSASSKHKNKSWMSRFRSTSLTPETAAMIFSNSYGGSEVRSQHLNTIAGNNWICNGDILNRFIEIYKGIQNCEMSQSSPRICIMGGEEVIHNILCAFVAYRATLEEKRRKLKKDINDFEPVFYLIPTEHSDVAAWIANCDPWYRRQMYIPFHQDLLFFPQLDWGKSSFSNFERSSFHSTTSPLSLMQELSSQYIRDAMTETSFRIFICECWYPENSDRDKCDHRIPFCCRLDIGFNVALKRIMKDKHKSSYDDALWELLTQPDVFDQYWEESTERGIGTLINNMQISTADCAPEKIVRADLQLSERHGMKRLNSAKLIGRNTNSPPLSKDHELNDMKNDEFEKDFKKEADKMIWLQEKDIPEFLGLSLVNVCAYTAGYIMQPEKLRPSGVAMDPTNSTLCLTYIPTNTTAGDMLKRPTCKTQKEQSQFIDLYHDAMEEKHVRGIDITSRDLRSFGEGFRTNRRARSATDFADERVSFFIMLDGSISGPYSR
eukprot:g289.t1